MGYWDGKVALVTGSSAGFGYSLAAALAVAGARVVLNARGQERLESAVASLTEAGCAAVGIPADVRDGQQVTDLFRRATDRFQRIDLLVNNAGQSARGLARETEAEAFADLLDLNFLSAVRCSRTGLEALLASRGHLVFIASLAAKAATAHLGAYPASKAPLALYAQQLRLELRDRGVHVLLVCPGPMAREDAGRRYADQVEHLPGSAAAPGGGVRLRGIDPERLAMMVLRSCERRTAELIVPARARLLFAVSQLWPSLGDAVLRRMSK